MTNKVTVKDTSTILVTGATGGLGSAMVTHLLQNTSHVAHSMISLFYLVGKYLRKLSDRIGGGFDFQWYENIYQRMRVQMLDLIVEFEKE